MVNFVSRLFFAVAILNETFGTGRFIVCPYKVWSYSFIYVSVTPSTLQQVISHSLLFHLLHGSIKLIYLNMDHGLKKDPLLNHKHLNQSEYVYMTFTHLIAKVIDKRDPPAGPVVGHDLEQRLYIDTCKAEYLHDAEKLPKISIPINLFLHSDLRPHSFSPPMDSIHFLVLVDRDHNTVRKAGQVSYHRNRDLQTWNS